MSKYKTTYRDIYVPSEDITIIVREVLDRSDNELVSMTITGFYHGEPAEHLTETFKYKRKARYD